jgi:hypothetical protein
MAFPSTELLQFMSKLILLLCKLFIEKISMIFKANLQNYKNSSSPADNTRNVAVNDSSWINPLNAELDSSWINPLNAELNPICHLLVLLGAHHILHVSRIRVNLYSSMRLYAGL